LDGVKRYLERHWAPLAEVPIADVERAAIAARLRELKGSSGAFAANRARAAPFPRTPWTSSAFRPPARSGS
jgi:hypothetical protein